MPRKGRGGKVEGSSQTAYSNRADLNARGPEPITTAPGQPYGQAAAQEAAQRAVPMAGVQTPTPPPSAPQNAPQAPMQAPQGQSMVTPPTREDLAQYDLFAPAPHPPKEPIANTPDSPTMASNPMAQISNVLEQAATSSMATRQVQELAAYAKTLV